MIPPLSPVTTSAPTPAWYGPATLDANLAIPGNPFDSTENNVLCVFTQGKRREERLAYYANGAWHATLSAPVGGTYTATFLRNGRPTGQTGKITLARAADGDFVLLNGTRFKLTSGKPYIPFGHNFGWQNGADKPYPEQLADMHKAGLNWTRVWSDSWDGKNPFVPKERETKLEIGRMWEPALDRWDMVVRECERNDIKTQFVLFHHGLFSTTTDSNWSTHPWSKANGGFLATPVDFFTDPLAKKLSRDWLRYAVARWGHSTAIMAWELFNEVQWVDATKKPESLDAVVTWHKEMGDYVRSIDPYHHLVTSSSSESLDARVFATMDYEQPHTYPPSVYGALLGTKPPVNRPLFYGEFGGPGGASTGAEEVKVVRDGVWGALLAGHAGPGQYWFWNRAYRANLYPEFSRESKILARSAFAEHPEARPMKIVVTGAPIADLVARPGRGWAKSDKTNYDLPADAGTGTFPELSGYIQGAKNSNRATMMKEPIRFRFNAAQPGTLTLVVGQSSRGGGAIDVKINGQPAFQKEYPAGERERRVNETFTAPFPAGAVEIVLDNPGNDWITLQSIRLTGVGSGVSAASLGSKGYALARLTWSKGFGPGAKSIALAGLADGAYELRQFDLDAGTEKTTRVFLRGGNLAYVPLAADEGIVLMKR